MIRINGKVMKRSDFRKECTADRSSSPQQCSLYNSSQADKSSTNHSKMDLLASILNDMDAPPAPNEEQRKTMRRQKEALERYKRKQKEELNRYRSYVEERIARFALDDRPYIEFQPVDKVHRSVIYELADYGQFSVMSFAVSDMDKYVMIFKKDCTLSEDEVYARRNGDGWNANIAKQYADKRRLEDNHEKVEHENPDLKNHPNPSEGDEVSDASEKDKNNVNNKESELSIPSSSSSSSAEYSNRQQSKATKKDRKNGTTAPTFNYQQKYAHLIGNDTSPTAVSKADAKRSYGFVPSQNKMDVRSIEQTMNELREKKRQRLKLNDEECSSVESASEAVVVARLLRSKSNMDLPNLKRHGSIKSALLESSSKLSIKSLNTDNSTAAVKSKQL